MFEEVWDDDTTEHLEAVAAKLGDIPDDAFTEAAVKGAISKTAKARQVKLNRIYMPLRYAVTGMPVGCGVPVTLALVGKERTVGRIARALHEVGRE